MEIHMQVLLTCGQFILNDGQSHAPSLIPHTAQCMHVHPHCTHGTCGVLDCLLFCDQTRPNLRISLVGYHCSIEFPCRVPLFYCCKYPTTYGVRVHTHTQTCKHRQTGSSHCSSFVYTLTFSQHLSYVLYTFGKRGPFSNWGPYCSFCYKSPVWMPKQTHTHTTLYTLWGTCGVLDCLLFCDQTRPNLRISLVGYHCAIEFPCGVPLFYCCKYRTPQPMAYASTHTRCTCTCTCTLLVLYMYIAHSEQLLGQPITNENTSFVFEFGILALMCDVHVLRVHARYSVLHYVHVHSMHMNPYTVCMCTRVWIVSNTPVTLEARCHYGFWSKPPSP